MRASDDSLRSWTVMLSSYLGAGFIGRCPANTQSRAAVTYAWSDLLVETTGKGISSARCQTPSTTLVIGESADSYTSEHLHFTSSRSRITFTQFKSSIGVERHGSGANHLFVDGHIETLAPTEVKNRLDAPNTTFLKP